MNAARVGTKSFRSRSQKAIYLARKNPTMSMTKIAKVCKVAVPTVAQALKQEQKRVLATEGELEINLAPPLTKSVNWCIFVKSVNENIIQHNRGRRYAGGNC
jgi:hypothetical protein